MRLRPILACAVVSWLLVVPAEARKAGQTAGAQTKPSQRKVVVMSATDANLLGPAELQAIALQGSPPPGLDRPTRSGLKGIAEKLRHKDRSGAEADWKRLLESSSRNEQAEVGGMIRYVLNAAYIAPEPKLEAAADKTRFYNAQRNAAHAQKKELEQAKGNGSVSVRPLTLTKKYAPGERAVTWGPAKPLSPDSVSKDLQRIVVLCNRADEASARAERDLLNELERRPETVEAMSAGKTSMHDAAKNMVNNLR